MRAAGRVHRERDARPRGRWRDRARGAGAPPVVPGARDSGALARSCEAPPVRSQRTRARGAVRVAGRRGSNRIDRGRAPAVGLTRRTAPAAALTL